MNYQEQIVDNDIIKSDVLCYWMMSGMLDNSVGVSSRYMPKGQSIMVFNFGDRIVGQGLSQYEIVKNQIFIIPAFKSSMIINQKGKIDLFGVSFIGEGLYKLIQQPVSNLKVNLPNGFRSILENLFQQLKESDFPDKINECESFLLNNINQKIRSSVLYQSFEIIKKTRGAIKVCDVARKVQVTERQLQRLFKTRVGISPKDYCKITRVNNYLDFIQNKGSNVDWMELVVEYDYHDQPHLIKEVKSIAKLSPKKLLSLRDTLYDRYFY